ncbi:Glyco_hydro_28 domain-containing protein [Cephalotus follicularis]|uniref:Glyco_hydro_28 domain-containing protein n=1 Tax=Cephalotus follicularis TaxID=3775 RepID=A0A1Q3BSL8_CEPFO|nr:Glyco_hydro_28 domain-containing protein [Cephalotus follicularis]
MHEDKHIDMMVTEKPNSGGVIFMGYFTRPSWAILLLLFALITILSLQISTNSVSPLRVNTGPSEPHIPVDKSSCAGFFGESPERKTVMSITDFGGVGDGKTSNTEAFRRAVRYMQGLGEKGGAQLIVPKGRWLTGSFNLTSYFTLFLQEGAIILASQDPEEWPIIEPLPSYGRGRERLGGRHISLIHGDGLTNVVITGQNGTIDGQGRMWWEMWWNRTLKHTRGHLLELMNSRDILISNLTFRSSPFWTIHPVYCSNVVIKDMTILAPLNAPNTDGIDPDSSTNVCIEDCYIESGDDLVAIKSGWDQYGIAMARPSSNIIVRRISGTTPTCSGFGIGSEMSGGIFNVTVEDLHVWDSAAGLRIKTDQGRGGFIANITISNIKMERVKIPIRFSRGSNDHPDEKWDPNALPSVKGIYIGNVVSLNSTKAPVLQGIKNAQFEGVCMKNVSIIGIVSSASWHCEFVSGYTSGVFPSPCPQMQNNSSSSWCR